MGRNVGNVFNELQRAQFDLHATPVVKSLLREEKQIKVISTAVCNVYISKVAFSASLAAQFRHLLFDQIISNNTVKKL